MSHERSARPSIPDIYQVYNLTETERLYDRLSHNRFQEIIGDDRTIVHTVEESYNSYGEFLFVTVSRPAALERSCMTFFGLGFHEFRERWLTDEWFWYQGHSFPSVIEASIPKEEALELVKQRLESISPYTGQQTQTGRGRLFEMLADLTDEDGAWAELQDMGDLADWLGDESD